MIFSERQLYQDAVVRNLEIIGEAVKRLPDELAKQKTFTINDAEQLASVNKRVLKVILSRLEKKRFNIKRFPTINSNMLVIINVKLENVLVATFINL